MAGVDDKVVSITFDNSQFARGVQETLSMLEQLEAALNFQGKGGGDNALQAFSGIDTVAQSAIGSLEGIGEAVDHIDSRFSTMGAVAFTALQSITNSALEAGKRIGSAILDPIIQGGTRRAHAIEQARFQFEGLGIDVELAMQSALDAVQGTAFGLDEAAGVAAQFGAGGLAAGAQMTGALRGVAGAASLVGTSYADMGSIFTDVAAQGKLTNAHLFSFSSRNLNMAAALAKQWGITEEAVREMATNGEISFEEFATAADAAFGEHATEANKTYSGALANLGAAMSRLGEDFLTPHFEGLRQVMNAAAPAIDRLAEAFSPLVDVYTRFVNITSKHTVNFLEGLDFGKVERILTHIAPNINKIFRNLRAAARSFLEPLKGAFSDVFNAPTIRSVQQVARAIQQFIHGLILSDQTSSNLRSTFSGLLAVLSIVWEVIKGVVGVIFDLVGGFSDAGGDILGFTGNLGDALVRLKEFLVDGGRIHDFFEDIGGAIRSFASAIDISGLISTFTGALSDLGGASGDRIEQRFSGLVTVGHAVVTVIRTMVDAFMWLRDAVLNILGPIGDIAREVFDYLEEAFGGVFESLADSLEAGDFNQVLDVLNVTVIGGLALALNRAISRGFGFNIDVGNGLLGRIGTAFDRIGGAFSQLTGVLRAMQTEIKSEALMNIAKAVALLTASVFALSLIDSADLSRALAAMTVSFADLVAAFALLDKIALTPYGAVRLTILSIGIMGIATAMVILSFAVRSMAKLDWSSMARGLAGLTGILFLMAVTVQSLSAVGMIRTGLGLIAIGIAINIIAHAVKSISKLDWGELGKGLSGLAGILLLLGTSVEALSGPGMIQAGLGLIAIGIALNIIALAVKSMAELDWGEMAKGLVGITGILFILSVAAQALETSILGGLGIIAMAAGLILLSKAIESMSDLGWADLGFGLFAIAAGLTVLGLAAYLLASTGALPMLALLGLALIPLAFGLELFAHAMEAMSDLGFADLGFGLLAIAAGLAVLGGAAYLLASTGALLALAGLGAALILLGIAFAAFGAGAYLVARAFEILSTSSDEAVQGMRDAVLALITLIPALLTEFAEGIIAFLQIILDAAPELIDGVVKVLGDLLEGITTLAPQLGEALVTLFLTGLNALDELAPRITEVGLNLIVSLMQGIRDNIPRICDAAREIIGRLVGCILENGARVIYLGGQIIAKLTQGIRETIGDVVIAGVGMIGRFIAAVGGAIGGLVSSGVQAVVRFVGGVLSAIGRALSAGATLVRNIINGIRNGAGNLLSAGVSAVGSVVTGIGNAASHLLSAGLRMAGDLIDGIIQGIGNGVGAVVDAVQGLASDAIHAATSLFGIGSPSKVFAEIGGFITEGLVLGIDAHDNVITSADNLATNVVKAFNQVTDRISAGLSDIDDLNPTITPVLDLSSVESEAAKLGNILSTDAIFASSSLNQAQAIINGQASKDSDISSPDGSSAPKEIKFEQTINAPTELSVGAIYRQTRSQIEMAKKELEKVP